jgi:cytochrome c oxidase subunit 3
LLIDTGPVELREQFATPGQQRETATSGMWIFLMTEVMMFGVLFTAFAVYRLYYFQPFTDGSSEMNVLLGSINTAVLICSSLTMAMAVHSAASGQRTRTVLFLLATIVIGAVFLGIKFTEYYQHFQEHKVPGLWFESDKPGAEKIQMFFFFYFVMTGLHAIHMLVGIGVVSVLAIRAAIGRISARYYTPIEIGGLYWHFVDIVWVFLYAIFYIPGMHK